MGRHQVLDALLAPVLGEGRLGDLLDDYGLKVSIAHYTGAGSGVATGQ